MRLQVLIAPVIPLVLTMTLTMQAAPPADIEARIDALLAKMTLEEKLGQMSQATGLRRRCRSRTKQEIRQGRWGSFLDCGGSRAIEPRRNASRCRRAAWGFR